MLLPELFRCPRVVELGGDPYFVRPLSLFALGTILAWLQDQSEDHDSVRLGSAECWERLTSDVGTWLLVWLALQDQGMTLAMAQPIALRASEGERARLRSVLFHRRRGYAPGEGGRDLAESWMGPAACKLMDHEHYPGLTLEAIGRLSLDQLDCLASRGLEDEQPVETISHITTEDPHAILERLRVEHPDFAQEFDRMTGATNGEQT